MSITELILMNHFVFLFRVTIQNSSQIKEYEKNNVENSLIYMHSTTKFDSPHSFHHELIFNYKIALTQDLRSISSYLLIPNSNQFLQDFRQRKRLLSLLPDIS